jgi:hypothetical protein
MPFQLEKLGYTKVSSLVGWPLFSYVRAPPLSCGRVQTTRGISRLALLSVGVALPAYIE